jgi:diguanylate cyclase (GGDEF)-like protein
MEKSRDQADSLDAVSVSDRDKAADRRDRAAEDRDLAAQVRDGLAARGRRGPTAQEELSARDRESAAEDRKLAAADRDSARHELAYEGLDGLTGVLRRRVGLAAIQREMDRAERSGDPLVLAFVDLIGLKVINDTQGHAAGDRALRNLAGCITQDLRSYDLVTRIGGDEFVCTLSGQSVEQAEERYREISLRLTEGSSGARMTVGFTEYQPGDTLDGLVDRADQAMIGARRYS